MKSLMQLRKNQRGDTIVEVMVVLAVLGLALSISYATANRSLLNIRQAQENSEAAELAQSQVEELRIMVSGLDPTSASYNQIITQGKPFCMNGTTAIMASDPGFAADCQNVNGLYDYLISYGYPSATDTAKAYQTVVTWPDVEGQGQDTVTLDYRIQPTL